METQAVSESRLLPEQLRLNPCISPATISNSNPLIPELQIFRGPGCLLVFAVHCVAVLFPFIIPAPAERSGSEYLPHSVAGFFILSGLVLALPFVQDRTRSFSVKGFYLERFFRLYPVYWLSICLALVLRYVVSHWIGLSALSPWPQQFWSIPLTPSILLQQFAGIAGPAKPINPAYWTLAAEIQGCLFFPLILVLVRRTRHWSLAMLAIVGMIVASHFASPFHAVRTANYFLMGAYVAKYNQALKTWLQRIPSSVLCVSFALFVGFLWIAPNSAFLYRISFLLLNLFLALSAVMVQAFRPVAVFARLRPVQKMADLSYCFYLVHLPILVTCAFLLQPRLHSSVLTLLVALSISIFVAWLGWRFIETPIRRWAKGVLSENRLPEVPQFIVSREPSTY